LRTEPALLDNFIAELEALNGSLRREVAGFVPNVVFPTGVVRDGESLLVYYGAADAATAVAEFAERELLAALTEPG